MEVTAGHRLPVPAALRPWIAGISLGSAGDRSAALVRLPDPATALVLSSATADGGIADGGIADGGIAVLGPQTRATYYAAGGAPPGLRLRIRPGRANLLLGRPIDGLVDGCVPLTELWGERAARLAAELAGLGPDPARALGPLSAALLDHLPLRPPADRSVSDLVYRAAGTLAVTGHVQATARRLHVSERHLRQLFQRAVGLPPKRFARIDRVRTVLARLQHTGLAQLAGQLGYYDQSHLTAEFRALMGVPPGAYLAGRFPAAVSCGAPHR